VRRRRIPFLFNILESLGIIEQTHSEIEVLTFIPAKEVIKLEPSEKEDELMDVLKKFICFR
jgi:hypothetical protein